MNTPTPRTDAATYPADCLGQTLVTNRDLARALERELASERARLDYFLRWDVTFHDRADIDRDMNGGAK